MYKLNFYDSLNAYKRNKTQKNELMHYGIIGQKWGTRRWQNADGTFNEEGKIRYFGKKTEDKIGYQMTNQHGQKVNEMVDYKKPQQVTKDVKVNWNVDPKYEKYQDQINEQAQKMLIDAMQSSNFKYVPKDMTVNVDKNGHIKVDFSYDDEPQKIGNIYDTGFNLRRKMLNSKWDQVGRKQFADAIKRNRDMVDAKNLTDEEIDEIINNRMASATNETLISDFNTQSLRYQMEKALNTKFGSSPDSKKIFENKTDTDYMDKDGNFDENKYWKDKEKAEKYLYDNYDKEFARTMIEDVYDTTGEWGDIDKQYEEYKKDPYHFTHWNIDPKAEKKATKLAKKINDELEETFKYDRKHEDEIMDGYILDDEEYTPLFENLRKSNNETLAKDYDKVEEIFKDYKGNDRGTTSRAIAGIVNFLEDDNQTMKDLAFETWFHAYEDGDQGYANGPSLYARYEKNIKPEEIDRLYTNLHANEKLMNDNIMYLKNNNQVLSKVDDKYLKRLVERNEDQWNDRRKTSAYWELYDAADGSRYDDTLKKNYQEAKQIAKKLEKSIPNGGWYYLNQAIDNLNMGDMNYKDLSQADWDRINAEINKLKK